MRKGGNVYCSVDLREENDLFYKRIGANVRELRLSRQLTQNDVSRRAQLLGYGYSRSTFSRIELGRKRTSTFDLVVLAQVFDVTVDRILIGGEEEHEGAAMPRAP